MDFTDKILIDIKRGDKKAFKDFFEYFYPILCAFAFKFLKNKNQSKDMAQEAFINFWEQKGNFEDLQGVKSFLYVVVKNKSLNFLKKSKKNDALPLIKELETESFFKKEIIDQETFLIVKSAVDKLPVRQKEIIKLSLAGLKNPQIAMRLQISPHTVHSAKKNAYRKLKNILKDNYYLLFLFNI